MAVGASFGSIVADMRLHCCRLILPASPSSPDWESECLMRERTSLQLSVSWTEGSSRVSGVRTEMHIVGNLEDMIRN
jgi:hypothetical protein